MINRQQTIIWGAMLMSTVIYFGLIYSITSETAGAWSSEKLEHPVVLGLYLAAAVMFVVATVLPGRIAPPEKRMVMSLALYESCAIFGLLAAFLQQDWRLFLAPWALALIGFMRVFPSAETEAGRGSV
jgi:hypothetical protein